MARPVGKLGPVPAGRGIGLWAPEKLPDGPAITNYLLLPFDWGVPFGPPPLLQTWAVGPNPNLLPPPTPAFVGPFNQDDWPLPRGYEYPLSLRFWAEGPQPVFVDNSKFSLPFDWGTPEGPQPLLQTWTFSSRALLAAVTAPFGQDDWPLPGRFTPLPQSWTLNLVLSTLSRPIFSKQFYDLAPRAYPEPATRTWNWSYNLNLVGQDQLPTGVDVYDLPPRPYPPPGLTWIQSFELPVFQQLPIGAEISDLVPRPYPEPATRTWAFAFNLNLIGKDRLPTGDQFFDLSPIAPLQILPRSWTWNYNLNLIAQDALVTGEQRFDLPPKGPEYPISLRSWIAFSPLTFIPAAAPFNQEDWPLPGRYTPIQQSWAFSLLTSTLLPLPYGYQLYDLAPRTHPEPRVRAWAWNYNLNLIGQDVLTVGEQVTDLVPRPYPEPATRTWTAWFNLNLIGRDRLLVGKQVTDLTPIAQPQILPRSWTWSYNLNLTGQDQLPTGEQRYDLAPVGPFYATQLRTWIYFTPPTPTFAIPFNQFDWPTPKPYPEPATRTWAASYNLNLIAQDRMVTGKQVYDLSPIAQPQILPRSWTLNLQQSTLQPIPYGYQWYERPPRGPIQPLREWTASYNLNLIGQDALPTGKQVSDLTPFGYIYPAQLRTWTDPYKLALNFVAGTPPPNQYDWPLPKGPLQPDRFYGFSFNLNLRGKDQLPTGKQISDLWPRPQAEPATRTQTVSFNLNLRGKDILLVGDQLTDLPPRDYQRSIQLRSGEWSYNRNLIGKDKLPTGDQFFDLAPRDHQRSIPLRSWIAQLNLALLIKPPPLPFNQSDWPLPTAWAVKQVGYRDYSFISGDNLCIGLPSPLPPVAPQGPQFRHNPGNEWQIYDRIREPGPVGWR